MFKDCNQSRVDSRNSAYHQTLVAHTHREVWLTLPFGAKGAVLNVVGLPKNKGATRGWLSVSKTPLTSTEPGTTVNWSQGATIGQSQVTTEVGEGKKIFLYSNVDAEFVIDVTGLYW